MKRDAVFFLSLFSFLFFLPGCGRLIDWGKEAVGQGEDLKKDLKETREHICSSRIYDQFTLIGAFDSLWLTDQVRETYVDLYVLKHGKTEGDKKVLLRRQLEENNHFISFYVLSVSDIVIGEKDSEWTLLLKIGDYYFVPTELKTTELTPEYKTIFGKKLTRFKTAYILRFNAKDIEDTPLIQPDVDAIHLVFRTTKKELVQSWCIRKDRKVSTAKACA